MGRCRKTVDEKGERCAVAEKRWMKREGDVLLQTGSERESSARRQLEERGRWGACAGDRMGRVLPFKESGMSVARAACSWAATVLGLGWVVQQAGRVLKILTGGLSGACYLRRRLQTAAEGRGPTEERRGKRRASQAGASKIEQHADQRD